MPAPLVEKAERGHNLRRQRAMRFLYAAILAVIMTATAACSHGPTPRTIASQAEKALITIRYFNQWGEESQGGSGFFIDGEGTFVTSHHVVHGANRLVVELSTGEQFNRVYSLSLDPELDVAVMKIAATKTPALALGSDHEVRTGDRIYAMGVLLEVSPTLSTGIICGYYTVRGVDYIQTTAPVAHGFSGGPVMDQSGRVIGVLIRALHDGQQFSLATPIRYVKEQLSIEEFPTVFEGSRLAVIDLPVARKYGFEAARHIDVSQGDEWNRQVLEQLAATEDAALKEKAERTHEVVTGELNHWENSVMSVELQQGHSYIVGAACDIHCPDMDLFLYDGKENLLASNVERTAHPMLRFTPSATGTYLLRVRMTECGYDPCTYGVSLFRELLQTARR